ncbi:uncharacterized protein BXZ73DRAFT_98674 [Epithele typhae]|uniref:uncharacterized protein n=1 Tax=Epithele typhae TaxID=378194 RepID=UPI002008B4A1|nr:uncharacterized protein BXZ73DRAFT_98674 [Epithele typhae]KAH9940842.1 hypothetical protein BXZ73DRAFT_98674 [Epithele typhae]
MSRRHPGNYGLPDNPTWIEFPRSDGDPSLLPKNTAKVVDRDGSVNFMRPVPLDESLALMWRINVGREVANRMGLAEGPKYVLKDFPHGYHMYDHNKGPEKAPRHDPYLCGSTSVNRFRSTNEFIPHALWLMTDATMNRGNCKCKYCTKQPQRIISDTMGLATTRRSSSIIPTPSASRLPRPRREPQQRQQRPAPTRPYASVRDQPRPPATLLTGPEQFVVPERDQDIRTAIHFNDLQRPRQFRKGELVWCSLPAPIRGQHSTEDICFWPGLVEEIHFKVESPKGSPDGDASTEHLNTEAAEGNPALGAANSPPTAPEQMEGKAPGVGSKCWYVYRLKLISVPHFHHVADDGVLPYLANAPATPTLDRIREELEAFLHKVSIPEMDAELENMVIQYNPMGPEDPDDYYEKFRRAALPYTLAIQMASTLAQFWLPTDQWECTFNLLPPTLPLPRRNPSASATPTHPLSTPLPAGTQTLHSVIQQSMTQNASSPSKISGPDGPVSEAQSIGVLGTVSRAAAAPQTVVQLRFQGVWWGTERIWTDELVRLKIARCQFAPQGTDLIYPPAYPSPSSLEAMEAMGGIADPFAAAGERGLFMRLEGLFVVDIPGPEGQASTRECRASGTVFELVDEDWEEPVPATANGTDKGKGKEREGPAADSNGTGSLPTSAAAAGGAAPKTDTGPHLSDQLSHPVLSTPYPLPNPPRGLKFRPILRPGQEAVVSLSLISGRYYPELFHHPLMAPQLTKAMDPSESQKQWARQLFAIHGLTAGAATSMEPRFWRQSRQIMLQEAGLEARNRLKQHWEEVKMERLHPRSASTAGEGASPMEVD